PWVQRITMFGGNPTAENIAAGNDTADETICQWMNSSGHRTNICSPSNTSLGTGYHQGQNCFYRYWTQDFGGGAQAERLYPGALFEDGAILKAGLIVRSPSPVKTAAVTVGTVETALANTFGTDLRGAWTATVSAANCAAYFFTASFDDGKSERFPPAGYLFYSETPEQCETPDGDPDIDTVKPDDTVPDDAASDDEGSDTTEGPDDETPDEGSSDHTSPFDFNPSKDDAGPANDDGPVDVDLVWPDTDQKNDAGCGCSLVF
ncbi:MAG TPA: CAP domain-containing protein, partial [bacterium]|nr:CAP domain-containing protein [bacterium]